MKHWEEHRNFKGMALVAFNARTYNKMSYGHLKIPYLHPLAQKDIHSNREVQVTEPQYKIIPF